MSLASASGARAPLAAQQWTLRARVLDEAGVPVVGARGTIAGSLVTAMADSSGELRLIIRSDTASLVIRRIGYEAAVVRLERGAAPDPLVVQLRALPLAVTGVLIPGERSTPLGLTVTRASVRSAPPLGEPDILRSLPLLPAVGMPNDHLARLNLAGAAADEAMLTLDGHPLQFPGHLSGLVGAFNVASLESAELLMHHVPATEDTRLGGRIALRTREASGRSEGEAVASVLAASATIARPLAWGGDFLASGRYTYLTPLMRRVYGTAVASQFPWPFYGDVTMRVGLPLGERWRAEWLGTFAHDWIDASQYPPGTREISIGEALGGLTLTRESTDARLSVRLSQDLALALQAPASDAFGRYVRIDQRWTSGEVRLDREHSAHLGLSGSIAVDRRRHAQHWHLTSSSGIAAQLPSSLAVDQEQTLGALSFEARMQEGEGRRMSIGGRLSSAGAGAFLAPRWSASLPLTPVLRLETALDRRYQFDAQAGDPTTGSIPPATFLLDRPRRVDGVAATLEWLPSMSDGRSWSVTGTVFARSYVARTDAIAPPIDTLTLSRIDFERVPARSAGLAVGLAFAGPRGLSFQGSYTYTHAAQRDSIGWFAPDWTAEHMGSGMVTLPVGRNWSMTTTVQARSGTPTTPIIARLLVPSVGDPRYLSWRPIYGRRNTARLPEYLRADIALRRTWIGERRTIALSLQAFNVLRRVNPLEVDWVTVLRNSDVIRTNPVSRPGVPLVPSIGLEIRW